LLLIIEYVLMYVLKALVAVFSICRAPFFFKITPLHGPHGNHGLYCCVVPTTQKTQLTWFQPNEFIGALTVA
jgi:hypothetical protein